jgi:Tfp pilus assembly protein PilN
MPNINLIAARRAEKKRLELLTRQLFFGLAGSLVVLLGVSSYVTFQQLSMQNELREAEEKMRILQPKLDRIAEIEDSIADVQPRVSTLKQAKVNTLRWRAVLQVISQSIPQSTWLTAVTASGSEGATSLRLSGYSDSQTLVGETMLRLQVHPLFQKVELDFTRSTPIPGANMSSKRAERINFGIVASLRNLAPMEDSQKKDDDKSINAEKRQNAVEKVSQNSTPSAESSTDRTTTKTKVTGGNNG